MLSCGASHLVTRLHYVFVNHRALRQLHRGGDPPVEADRARPNGRRCPPEVHAGLEFGGEACQQICRQVQPRESRCSQTGDAHARSQLCVVEMAVAALAELLAIEEALEFPLRGLTREPHEAKGERAVATRHGSLYDVVWLQQHHLRGAR